MDMECSKIFPRNSGEHFWHVNINPYPIYSRMTILQLQVQILFGQFENQSAIERSIRQFEKEQDQPKANVWGKNIKKNMKQQILEAAHGHRDCQSESTAVGSPSLLGSTFCYKILMLFEDFLNGKSTMTGESIGNPGRQRRNTWNSFHLNLVFNHRWRCLGVRKCSPLGLCFCPWLDWACSGKSMRVTPHFRAIPNPDWCFLCIKEAIPGATTLYLSVKSWLPFFP